MTDPIPDKTAIIIIISTILIIFLIAFLVTAGQGVYDQQIEWRDVDLQQKEGFNL